MDSLPPSRAPRGRCPPGAERRCPPFWLRPGGRQVCSAHQAISPTNPLPGPCGDWHFTTAAESWAPRPWGPLSAGAQHVLWPGWSLPGGSAPGTSEGLGLWPRSLSGPSLPRDRGLQGNPKAALMSPRVHACAAFL